MLPDTLYELLRAIFGVGDGEVAVFGAIGIHQVDHVVSAAYVNTDIKWVHGIVTPFL